MAIRTYKVTLDTKNAIAPEPVLLRQGDKTGAVVIDAILMDNGSPVSLSGLTPMFKANTADGQAVIADSTGFNIVNASGGELTYQVPNALAAVPGKITTAYFSFSDSSGSESTFDVAFIIKKSVDITKPKADDYITIIDGTLRSLQQKIDAMNNDIQNVLNAYNQGDFYNKGETDSKDAATLSSAKSYADGKSTEAINSANGYADTQATNTLNSAKEYTDRKKAVSILGGAVTGYKSGIAGLVRSGKVVVVKLVLETGDMDAGWGLFAIPAGFRPSSECVDMQFQITGGRVVILRATGFAVGQHFDAGWWTGSCTYLTDDDWPS